MDERAPWLYRVVAARSGQSEPIGLLFVIGLTVMASAVVVVLGAQAIQETESSSELQRAEHVMTLFDSRAASIALSDSSSQRLQFPASGTHTVRPGTGWLSITHTNYHGDGDTEELYNGTFGSVTYDSGDTTIAYQGGGVWRLADGGTAQMISPPEFHYRGATLTLPVIRVSGSGSVAGGGSATIQPVERAKQVFPDRSANYDGTNSPDKPYLNPAENGTMNVTVKSRYYEGWAQHFRDRTDGTVTVDHAAHTATVQLLSLGETGDFAMPHEAGSANGDDELLVRGLAGEHTLENFDITIFADEKDSANLNNLQWSMYGENGDRRLELHLTKESGGIRSFVYFSANGGDDYEGWRSDGTYSPINTDVDGDGDLDTALRVNFTGSKQMEYTSLSSSAVVHFDNPSKDGDLLDPVTWDEHDANVSKNGGWESEPTVEFRSDNTTQIGNVTRHYLARMGTEWELRVDDFNGDSVNEDGSRGNIEYPGSDRFITYLHVTENEVSVRLN